MTASGTVRRLAAGRRHRRARPVAVVVAALLVLLAGPAYGYWAATSNGNAQAKAATLALPVLTAGSVTSTSAALSWTQPFVPTAYTLSQSPGGTVTGCPAPAPGSTACSATSLTPNTSYTWTLAASFYNWVGSATVSATTPRQPTTTTLGAVTPTTGAAGTAFSATATVAGWGTPAGTALLSLYPNATCTGAASYSSSLGLTLGAATASLSPVAGTYHWQAGYTPTDAYNAPSTSACGPSVTVTTGGLTYAGASSPVIGKNNGGQPVSIPYPTGATGATLTKPGDLVLLVLARQNSADAPAGSGWTPVTDDWSKGGLTVWWHAAAVGETSVTLTSLAKSSTAWVLDYTKASPPVLGPAGSVSDVGPAGSTFTPAKSLTTTQPSTVISLAALSTAGILSLQAAQGLGLDASLASADRVLGVADRFAPTAGTVTPPTWAGGTPTTTWAYATLAFTSGP